MIEKIHPLQYLFVKILVSVEEKNNSIKIISIATTRQW